MVLFKCRPKNLDPLQCLSISVFMQATFETFWYSFAQRMKFAHKFISFEIYSQLVKSQRTLFQTNSFRILRLLLVTFCFSKRMK